jgi:hypothetical protein
VRDLTLSVIEWKPRVTGRKIYFGGESGVVLGSLAASVTAPGFEFSAYAYSPFFSEIAKALPESLNTSATNSQIIFVSAKLKNQAS